MATAYTDQVQKVYIAYYGRAADPVGLAYWAGKVETDGLAGIMANFGASAEATTLYGSLTSDTAKVNALYQQSFGRDADFAGLMYYAGQLSAGTMTAVSIAQNIFDGASGTDATLLANKLTVAKAYTTAIDTAAEVVAYSGTVAATAARTLLSTVKSDTVTASFDVATSVAAIVATSTAKVIGQGTTYTLTSAAVGDDITGTAYADTFSAASTARLQDADVIEGGLGIDTLNASTNSTSTHDASMSGIEILNFKQLANTTILGTNIAGATNVNISGGKTFTYTGVNGEEFSLSDKTTALTVTDSNADTATDTITIDMKSGALGTMTLGDQGGTDYETINLKASGATSATLIEAGTEDFSAVGDSIVLTGAGDFVLTVLSAAMGVNGTAASTVAATVDASGHDGKFTLDLGSLDVGTLNNVSAANYKGVDVIKVGLSDSNSDVSEVQKVKSGTEIIINDTEAADNKITVTQSGTATTDALTITLADKTKGTAVDITGIVADGFEKLTVNSAGTDSATVVVKNVVDDIAGLSSDTTLTITGDKYLTATGIESTFVKISSTNTAGSDLTVDAGGALAYTGSAVKDRLELDTVADIASTDVLNGGGGHDTLAISQVIGTDLTTAQRAVVSNFEALEYEGAHDITGIAAATIDLTKITGVNEVFINGVLTTDTNDVLTINADDGMTLRQDAAHIATIVWQTVVVTNAADAGTDNTVNWALDVEAAGAGTSIDGLVIDNVENLSIAVSGVFQTSDVITVDDIDGAQLQTLTISSKAGITASTGIAKVHESLIITTVETTMLSTLDASAATGAFNFVDVSAFVATGATIKGGSAVDTLTGGVGADVISGNAGADILNGEGGNDSISGGAAADNINGAAGADSLTGGAGKDVFVFADAQSISTAYDKVTDFGALATDAEFDTLDIVLATDNVYHSLVKASAHDVTNHTTETETGTVTAYTTNGVIKLTGTQISTVDTLAEWLLIAADVVVNGYVDNGGSDAGSETVTTAFEFGGNTYVVTGDDGDSDNTYATESVVELTGLVGVIGISTTEANNVIHVS